MPVGVYTHHSHQLFQKGNQLAKLGTGTKGKRWKISEKSRENKSKALKGNTNTKGKTWKWSKRKKEWHPKTTFKKKHIPWNVGLTKETDERVFKSSQTLRKTIKGRIPWNKGLKGVQVSKYKGKSMPWMQKERHPMWKGGISRYYPPDWEEIRKRIYQRDKYSCQSYNCKNEGKRVPLDVHHIDDNVFNNKLSNLISLCRSCHVKLHWQLRLQNYHKKVQFDQLLHRQKKLFAR